MGRLKAEMEDRMALAGYAPSTIRLYVTCVGAFARHFGVSPLDLGAPDIEAFLLGLRKAGRSTSTVHIYYEAIRTFYTQQGLQARVPTLRFRHEGRRLTQVPRPAEVQAFLESIPSLRLRLAFTLAYSGGLRISELVALRLADLDTGRGIIKVVDGKGRKDRQTLLASSLLPLLSTYLSVYRPWDRLLFRQGRPDLGLETGYLQRAFKRLASGSRAMEGCTTHSLRHCFATHLVEEGVNIFHVMRLLGHSQIQSTLVYLHMAGIDGLGLVSPLDRAVAGSGGPGHWARRPGEFQFLEAAT